MGKSDSFVFKEYLNVLSECNNDSIKSVAFLGFLKENDFTLNVNGKIRHFYDKSLSNWEINSNWSLLQKYDLIVCTRCAYFSKNPQEFILRIKSHLNKDGFALVDWGLGDHWRFKNYKVGWVRHQEHEWAYDNNNLLHSCFWNDSLLDDKEVKSFWNAIKQNNSFVYQQIDELKNIIKQEVPCLVDYQTLSITTKFLWPTLPQLYIITLITQ